MTQHTPGPWFIWQELAMQREGMEPDEIADELLYDSEHCIYAGNPVECTRGRLKGYTAYICGVDADSFVFDDDEDVCRAIALANARLISAAPELLEALQMMLEFPNTGPATSAARAAIAKATGKA